MLQIYAKALHFKISI